MNTTSLKKPRRPPFTSYSELTEALDAATARAEKAETELDRLRAEVERLKELLRIEFASAQHALAWAERAEAALAEVEGQTSTTLLNMQQRNADLRAEVERLRSDRDCEKRLRKDADEFRENAIARAERAEAAIVREMDQRNEVVAERIEQQARAERAEAALAIERQTLSGVIKLKMHFEAESLEQARLLGMSASREASLLGKISRLEHQLEK